MQTYYQREISKKVAPDIDPRHVEGYMRLQHGVLSELSPRVFNREIKLCVECIKHGGIDAAERNAQSFGL